jgi:hypothetical protein
VRDLTEYDEVGREGSIVRYSATVNESTLSEVLIFFDEAIGLPVRQEFYSIEGETRDLRYTVELRNFATQVDPAVFAIPADFLKQSSVR